MNILRQLSRIYVVGVGGVQWENGRAGTYAHIFFLTKTLLLCYNAYIWNLVKTNLKNYVGYNAQLKRYVLILI